MPALRKVEHLVVDTTAFIKNASLQDLANNLYTVQGVLEEIVNKRQLRNLVVLPYELKVKDVFPENIKFVTEFSKKTGDYGSLSAVDIQVMGLAYQLEKEHVGTQHLRTEPVVLKVDKLSQQVSTEQMAISGFYMPSTMDKEEVKEKEKEDVAGDDTEDAPEYEEGIEEQEGIGESAPQSMVCAAKIQLEGLPNVDPKSAPEAVVEKEKIAPEIGEEEDVDSEETREVVREVLQQERQRQAEAEELQAMQDLEEALRKTQVQDLTGEAAVWATETVEAEKGALEEESDEDDDLWDENAWITPDNVEEVKKELKGAAEEVGTATVACVTSDFAMQFSLPKPQGGKHAVNPILCPDQRLPQQFASTLARVKNNPLDPDYIAGYSPFVMRDVTSRSAVLGIRSNHTQIKNWMRRNPNEVVKKGKKRR